MTRYINPSLLQLAALGIEDDAYLPDGRHLRWSFSPDLGFPRTGFRLVRRPSPLPWTSKRDDVTVRRAPLFANHIADGEIRHREGIHVTAADGSLDGAGTERFAGVSVGSDTVRIRFTEDGTERAASTPACWVMVRYRHRNHGSIAASAVFVDGDSTRIQDRGASGRNLADVLGRLIDTVDVTDIVDFDAVRRLDGVEHLPTLTDASIDDDQLTKRRKRVVIDAGDLAELDDTVDATSVTKRVSPVRRFDGPVVRPSKPATAARKRRAADEPNSGRQDATPSRRKKTDRGPFVSVPRFSGVPPVDVGPILGGGIGGSRPGTGAGDADEWVTGTFLLNGSVIDEVHVTGRFAELELVEWITVDEYADADGWQSVDRLFLPIDGDDVTYPAQPESGETVAKQRLEHAPPTALAPWDEPTWPPDPATESEIDREHQRRYLDGYDDLAKALETLVATEVKEAVPQRAVRYGEDEPMSAVGGTTDDLSGSSIGVPLLDMLQVASLDPAVARMLGLATTDYEAPDEHVDYMVSANWWTLWVWGVLAPHSRDRILDMFAERDPDENGVRLPLPRTTHRDPTHRARLPQSQQATVVSVATDVSVAARDPVTSPTGLDSDVTPRVGARTAPATVSLSWDAQDANLFTDDGHVAYAVRRRHDGADESIARDDPETDPALPLPNLPASTGDHTFTDRAPELGDSTYRVSGMDLWGRWSDFADTTATVADTVPPPAPTGLRAELVGDDGPTWDLTLSFDWTGGQRQLAPDTARFEIHCEQGTVDRSFAGWNGCETQAGVHSPLSVSWDDLAVATPLSGVTATVDPASAATDRAANAHITVTIPDVHAPFDPTDHRARVSVTVVAVDDSGNASDPARRAVADRVDPVEPTTEPLVLEPQVATWPDADGYSYWTAEWSGQPAGSRTQVLRAPQARLLAAAGESLTTFDARDTTDRVQRLRVIATDPANQHAFSPDHEQPYDDGETRHQVALPANDRGWTVVTVRHTGPTGTRAPWPTADDRFAVVRTPPTARPPTPELTATTDRDAPGEIQLAVAPDTSGATDTVRLYRTADRGAVEDVRNMRPLVPISTTDGDPTVVQDGVPPDRWYAYRAVAESAGGLRSPPTEPVWVRAETNQPPSPPVIRTLIQPASGSQDREISVTVAGYDLEVTLERRLLGTRHWSTVKTWQLADLTAERSPRDVTLHDRVPRDKADARFEYRVLVVDRRDVTATSVAEVRR